MDNQNQTALEAIQHFRLAHEYERKSLYEQFYAGQAFCQLREQLRHGQLTLFLKDNDIPYHEFWTMLTFFRAFESYADSVESLFGGNLKIAKTAIHEISRLAQKGQYVTVDYAVLIIERLGVFTRSDVGFIKDLPDTPETKSNVEMLIDSGVVNTKIMKVILENPDFIAEAQASGYITVPDVTESGVNYVQKPLAELSEIDMKLATSAEITERVNHIQQTAAEKVRDINRWVKTDVVEGTVQQLVTILSEKNPNNLYRVVLYAVRE